MLMRRLSGTLAFGTTMLRMPFFREALTASWSTLAWKLKLRSNLPTLRSEIQYCDFGASVFGASLAGSETGTASADDSAAAEALAGASSSSTVGWCDFTLLSSEEEVAVSSWPAGFSEASTTAVGRVPDSVCRSERPL